MMINPMGTNTMTKFGVASTA